MSVKLPDGSIISLATTLAVAKAVTGISNANPGVVSCVANGYSNADLVVMASGMSNIDGRVFRVSADATDNFSLEGLDTTLTSLFPAGSGAGTASKITAWQQITQIMGFQTSGGDQQYTSYSFLEQNFETQIPTIFSAQSLTLDIADDPSLPGYQAIKAASDARAVRPLKFAMPDGSFILYNAHVSFNETPSSNKGQVMTCKATFSLVGRPVRYAS